MARKKRDFETFNLSFLDVMCCGFGAVILIFLLIDHSRKEALESADAQQIMIVDVEDLIDQTKQKVNLLEVESSQTKASTIQETKKIVELLKTIQKTRTALVKNSEKQTQIKKEAALLEEKLAKLPPDEAPTPARFVTKRTHQELEALDLNGKRMVILFDRSASMLDDDLVNIILRRNGSEEAKRSAPKWQRALRMLDWLETKLSASTYFQIYPFNTKATPPIPQHANKWIRFDKGETFRQIVDQIKTMVPAEGTSLYHAFAKVKTLSPAPDSLLLITDSLPTQGFRPSTGKVSGTKRVNHFLQAIRLLPKRMKVNTILLPMEGDPMAAPSYWDLATATQGSFITPSADWP